MIISFARRANTSYHSIKAFIQEKWGEHVAEAFEQKILDFLDILEVFPEIGILENTVKKIYGFQVTRQTRVFYRIKKDKIIILVFFDVRQSPKKRNLS